VVGGAGAVVGAGATVVGSAVVGGGTVVATVAGTVVEGIVRIVVAGTVTITIVSFTGAVRRPTSQPPAAATTASGTTSQRHGDEPLGCAWFRRSDTVTNCSGSPPVKLGMWVPCRRRTFLYGSRMEPDLTVTLL
jgi:hypothetical protein